jgi:hypothetical protein
MKVQATPSRTKPGGPNWWLGLELAGFVAPEDGHRGSLVAWDPVSGKKAWEVPPEDPELGRRAHHRHRAWSSPARRQVSFKSPTTPPPGKRALELPDRQRASRACPSPGRRTAASTSPSPAARPPSTGRWPAIRSWRTCPPAARSGPSPCREVKRGDVRSAARPRRVPVPCRRQAERWTPRQRRHASVEAGRRAYVPPLLCALSRPQSGRRRAAPTSICAPSRRTTRRGSCSP